MARIEEWELFPSLEGHRQLVGRSYGHPRKKDGSRILVPVLGVQDGKVVSTSEVLWELGEPHPEYEAEFPGAKERMAKALADEEAAQQQEMRKAFEEGIDILNSEYKG